MSDIRFCSAADRPRHPIYCILQYCSIGAHIAHQKWYQFQTQCIQEYTDFSAPFHVLSINQSIVVSIVILCIWGAFRPAETVVTAAWALSSEGRALLPPCYPRSTQELASRSDFWDKKCPADARTIINNHPWAARLGRAVPCTRHWIISLFIGVISPLYRHCPRPGKKGGK